MYICIYIIQFHYTICHETIKFEYRVVVAFVADDDELNNDGNGDV